MIVRNLDVERLLVVVRPLKANTPLLVDPNAELPPASAAECLKAIAGQLHQIAAADGGFQNVKATLRLIFNGMKLFHPIKRRVTSSIIKEPATDRIR